ncbi:MAG: S8 family serine peptidase [Burkholderiales bacterium]|nr:S8 family serine peptidase [Burkholderiales bacterium]
MRFNHPCRLGLTTALAAFLLAACGGGGEDTTQSVQSAAAQPREAEAANTSPIPRSAPAKSAEEAATASSTDDGRRKLAGKAAPPPSKLYIVQLAEPPAAANPSTKPAPGSKLDRRAANVVAYVGQLRARQDAVARSVGARKVHDYSYVFNGFSAELTDSQVQRLRATKGVLAVSKDERRKLDTASTPAFLGLSGNSGFWAQTGFTGENIVIGMVDSGVWPENPAFSDKADAQGVYTPGMPNSGYAAPVGWSGTCVSGTEFSAANCNNKLIGARYYNAGQGGDAAIAEYFPWEYNSPRDFGGHGTHTASTAGGNSGVPITGQAAAWGTISGMAPRARLAIYKVCWEDGDGGTCASSDSVAAIDQAVADGVDVINFSVSGSRTTVLDPVEIAFMYAAEAGVFVATSAGNSGPTASTVAHASPWVTTVAANTHARGSTGIVTLGNGTPYTGSSTNATAINGIPLIDATQAGKDGADAGKVSLCYPAADNGGVAVLDPDKVAGKIVVCDRGVIARVNKSLAVAEAGGLGVILVNVSSGSVDADFHSVPTVHLAHTYRTAVRDYALAGGGTASIGTATLNNATPAPLQSSFSSRGPSLANRSEILKPDISAPGQAVLAAVAPPFNFDRDFDLYNGTSMSSPHIAGIGALFKQAKPTWSPMMIKSALMTTATGMLGASQTSATTIFGQGAGQVQPTSALNPGLVFDHGIMQWLGYLCSTEIEASFCTSNGIKILLPRNVNLPSISVANVAGTQTVTRTVRNVSGAASTYTPTVSGISGFNVSVSPSSLRVKPGASAKFSVTFTRNGAALNTYVGGQLTWSDGVHSVRLPIVAQPVALAAPAEVSGSYTVGFGYTGSFATATQGMQAALKQPHTITTGVQRTFTVNIPEGTAYARFALYDNDVSLPADLDLYVYKGDTLVGAAASATSTEIVSLSSPAAGTYTVVVDGYGVPGGPASFNLYSWALPSTTGGTLSVIAPASVASGGTGTIKVRPCINPVTNRACTLPAGNKYLGSIGYSGSAGMPAPTIVFIE